LTSGGFRIVSDSLVNYNNTSNIAVTNRLFCVSPKIVSDTYSEPASSSFLLYEIFLFIRKLPNLPIRHTFVCL